MMISSIQKVRKNLLKMELLKIGMMLGDSND